MHPFTQNDRKSGLSKIARICLCILFAFSATGPVLIASAAPGGNFTYEYDYGNFSVIHVWTADSGNITGFNVSYNGGWSNTTWTADSDWHNYTWYNGTVVKFKDTVGPHGLSSIGVSSYNVHTSELSYIGSSSNRIPNSAPELASIGDRKVLENGTLSIELSATDLDGDALTFDTNASFGIFDGQNFSWTPDYGDNGVYSVEFNVTDDFAVDSEIINITVTDVNRAPQFNGLAQQYIINETEPLSFTVTATDLDKDELNYTVSGDPSSANLTFGDSVYFEWTPSYDDAGTYSVTFLVSDGLDKDSLIIPIVVNNVNRAPSFSTIKPEYEINESETLTINLGAYDPDKEDSITVWVNNSDSASGTLNGDIYTWDTDYLDSGTYNIEFAVSDGNLNKTSIATVTINNLNAPPVFKAVSSKVVEINENLQFTVNATDTDGSALIYSVVGTLPTNATFDNSTCLFDWTPADGQEGTYSVKFQVTDGDDYGYLTVPITVKDSSTSTSSSSSSSGGGGGGGGGATAEAYENIDFKDYTIKPVLKDVETVFSFGNEEGSIISVGFTASLNGGQTKAVVEMLKGTSSLVSKDPSGTVYKNMNILIGDGKFLPSLLSDATVVFKVEKSWIDTNDIDPDSIKLLRYSGNKWNQLSTSRTGENDEYFYYVAETPGFSPFAISSVDEEVTTVEASGEEAEVTSGIDVKNSVEDVAIQETNTVTQEEKSAGFPFLVVLVLLGAVFIGLFKYKREYCQQYYGNIVSQFSNHDGKRYRRAKR